MSHSILSVLADITVQPDFTGLPRQVMWGLQHLTDNAAALLFLVAGFGISVSLLGFVAGHFLHLPHVAERSKTGLVMSVCSGAILYLSVAAANYALGLFR